MDVWLIPQLPVSKKNQPRKRPRCLGGAPCQGQGGQASNTGLGSPWAALRSAKAAPSPAFRAAASQTSPTPAPSSLAKSPEREGWRGGVPWAEEAGCALSEILEEAWGSPQALLG